MVVFVLLSMVVAGEVVSLVIALAAWRSRPERCMAADEGGGPPEVSVIIPVLGAPGDFKACLKSVTAQSPSCSEVLVILQDTTGEQRGLVEGWIADAGAVELLELPGGPSKARAVRLGLSKARSEWILLVDADTVLFPGAVDELLRAARGHDAAYGVIVPREAAGSGLLHSVVRLEKLLSHGLWRLGRWALGLGPNLPGQCYIGRASVLQAIYSDDLGYLDDVALSGCLLAKGARVNFAPALVASEAGRSTWLGLLLQRGRYTVGLLQTFMAVYRCGGSRAWAWLCLSLHAWVYYGSCIIAVALTVLFLAFERWGGAALFVSSFLANRLIFACLAASALRRLGVPTTSVWPGWLLIPSVVVLAMVKAVGATAAVGVYASGFSRRSNPSMYQR
jgi:cellulose synthase/poly-beta-1,6-N-acetylglucosamine synthase-like glycosyltransferase